MKKVLAVLLAALMMFGLAACTPKTPTDNPGTNTPEETFDPSVYEITEDTSITFFHSYSNAKRAAWLEDMAAKFMEANPLVHIELVNYGGHPAVAEAVTGALSAGTGLPAISTINAPRVQEYANSGILEPLDNYLKAYGVDTSEYYDGMIDAATYDPDGHIYGLPFGVSAGICMYNKTLCDELNLPFPQTWDEFKTWCKNVYDATGKPAFGFAYDFNYLNTFFLNVTGIDPLGDGTKSKLGDKAITDFVREVRELVQNGYCLYIGEKVNGAQDEQLALFQAGELAAYTDTSTGAIKAITAGKNAEKPFEVGFQIGVAGKRSPAVTTVSGAYLIFYNDADQLTQQQKNAAVKFGIFLTNAENIASWSVDTQMFSVRPAANISKMYEKYPELESVFGHVENVVTKNKVSCMQKAMEAVAGVFGDIVKGDVAEANIDSAWNTLIKEVDGYLADAQ